MVANYGRIHFDDLQSTRSYRPGRAYSQSKLADLLMGVHAIDKGQHSITFRAADSDHVGSLAVEMLRWAKPWLGLLGKPIWVVADGAYAKADFLKPAAALGMTAIKVSTEDQALEDLAAATGLAF